MNETILSELGQRISWMLVHSVWQFASIAVVLAVGLRLLRGRSSHVRYGVMLAAMFVMAISPVVTFCVVSPEIQNAELRIANPELELELQNASRASLPMKEMRATSSQFMVPPADVGPAEELNHRVTEDTETESSSMELRALCVSMVQNFVDRWMNVILAVWLAGMLVLSIRPLIGWRATRSLRSRGRSSVSDSIAAATKRVAERLGVRRVIEVAQSSLVEVPTMIGWLKPLVLLPASAVSGLSVQQLEAVIAHELAHVRRHDYLVNLFQLLMETVFFYHPAVWWVSHRMRVEREECCDDIAVHMTGDRVGYAKLLVWLEESRDPTARQTLAMSADGGSLLNRVHRLLSTPTETTGIGPLVIATVLTFVVVTGVFLAINPRPSLAQENDSPHDDRTAVQVTEDGSIKLLAVMPRQASADKAWHPDGTRFTQALVLPNIPSNSTTRKLSGFDLVFQYNGLENFQSPAYRIDGLHTWVERQ